MSNGADSYGPDPICEDDSYPRYPEGEYDVICFKAVTYPDPRYRGRGKKDGQVRPTWKCRLDCYIVSSQEPISGFFNMGNESQAAVARGSEYRRVWIMANGKAPEKRQRMSKRVFVGKAYRVRVGDVRKTHDQRPHPDGAIYSTIKEFIACLTGIPPTPP